jgi:hypothetical protein
MKVNLVLLHTMKNIVQGAPWCVLISKNTSAPFKKISKKLHNVVMVTHSENSRKLQHNWNLEGNLLLSAMINEEQ